MGRLILNCSICKKPLVLKSSTPLGKQNYNSYTCGHSFLEDILADESVENVVDYTSTCGTKRARKYQETTVDFVRRANFRCIIGHEQRIGKTPSALLAIKSELDKLVPCLLVVQSNNFRQWIEETKTWVEQGIGTAYPIRGGGFVPPGFKFYVVTMDGLASKGVADAIIALGIKIVVVDEAHKFKNPDSLRSIMLKKIVSETTCKVICLSGTPVMNSADEWFVPLNLVAPERFPSLAQFKSRWLQKSYTGNRWDKILPHEIENFHKHISDIYLRYTRSDVFEDYPDLNQTHTVIEIEDKNLKKAYNKVLDKMEADMDSNKNYSFFDSLGELMLLRQICGLAKVDYIAERIQQAIECDILTTTRRVKYAIGAHHKNVIDRYVDALKQYGVVTLTGSDNSDTKYSKMKSFETDNNQVIIISELAGGTGMDFPFIDNVLIAERQWNNANEQQFVMRFYNPDKKINPNPTDVEFILAAGTLDEFLHNLVEDKRIIQGQATDPNWDLSKNPQLFKELLAQTIQGRL